MLIASPWSGPSHFCNVPASPLNGAAARSRLNNDTTKGTPGALIQWSMDHKASKESMLKDRWPKRITLFTCSGLNACQVLTFGILLLKFIEFWIVLLQDRPRWISYLVRFVKASEPQTIACKCCFPGAIKVIKVAQPHVFPSLTTHSLDASIRNNNLHHPQKCITIPFSPPTRLWNHPHLVSDWEHLIIHLVSFSDLGSSETMIPQHPVADRYHVLVFPTLSKAHFMCIFIMMNHKYIYIWIHVLICVYTCHPMYIYIYIS